MEIKTAPIEAVLKMRHEVMYPQEKIDFVKLEDDDRGIHLGLYVNNELQSVISLFINEDEVQFRKFATRVVNQNRGYGTFLLQHVFDWCRQEGKKRIWCNARQNATALYRKLGMLETGEPWKKYGLDFIKMEKRIA